MASDLRAGRPALGPGTVGLPTGRVMCLSSTGVIGSQSNAWDSVGVTAVGSTQDGIAGGMDSLWAPADAACAAWPAEVPVHAHAPRKSSFQPVSHPQDRLHPDVAMMGSNRAAADAMGVASAMDETPILSAVGLGSQAASAPDLGDATPRRLSSIVPDPGPAAAVYDVTGRMLGRFPTDEGGIIYFLGPEVYNGAMAYLADNHGTTLTEVYHPEITAPREVLEDLCMCYLDSEGLGKIADIAAKSGDGDDFMERFYCIGFKPGNKQIQVHDLSDEIDALWDEGRTSASVSIEYSGKALAAYEKVEGELVVIATGHTHPSDDPLESCNYPSLATATNEKDYFKGPTQESNSRAGLPIDCAAPLFVASQRGLTIHQSMAGTRGDGSYDVTLNAFDDMDDKRTTDRYGIWDAYDFEGAHLRKDVSSPDAARLSRTANGWVSVGAPMNEEQKEDRFSLIEELGEHKKNNDGRL
jgi:hypothetical protein